MYTEQPGYAGKLLRVDLDQQTVSDQTLAEGVLRTYVGGVGLGARLLYDEVPPGVGALDPENRLIMLTGPLNGAPIGGAGSFCIVAKGPLTNGATSTQANGYFGAFLKLSGYDAVVVHGRAKEWVYLHVHDGGAELRDARWLEGKDTWETEDLIKGALGKKEREASVYSIGPAGENLVRFASIVGDRGHVAAHNGVGAVMGSKRLKAVVVERGRGTARVADRKRVSELSKEMVSQVKQEPPFVYEWGTSMLYQFAARSGQLPVRNLTTNIFPDPDDFIGPNYRPRLSMTWSPCWACQAHHCHVVKVLDGPHAGYVGEEPEYEAWAAWTSLIDQRDPGAVVMLNGTVDRLGMDVNEAGWLTSLVMECYEKGVLTTEETDGLEMTWGNVEAVRDMLHRIAHRKGFGDTLAEGVLRAAETIGGEAPDFAVCTGKGHAPRGHDHRGRWLEMLDVATSGTGTIETGPGPVSDPFSPSEVPAVLRHGKILPFMDSLVVCALATGTYAKGGWHENANLSRVIELLRATTGWDYNEEEAAAACYRTSHLLRAFNIRHGIGPEVEVPSARYRSTPVDGPCAGKSVTPHWEQMLDAYYQSMGWDRKTGRPLPLTLIESGLESVVADLW